MQYYVILIKFFYDYLFTECEENEIWLEEGCEKSCNDSKQCKVAACLCKEGFKRSINNSCIPQKTCDLCIINGKEKMASFILIYSSLWGIFIYFYSS